MRKRFAAFAIIAGALVFVAAAWTASSSDLLKDEQHGTSAEDVTVYTAKYGPLAGHDIAASGIQWCGGGRHDPAAVHGLQLWDVTNPAQPKDLGFFDTGCCTRGVHEFEVASRADLRKTFAYVTVPAGHYPDDLNANGIRDARGLGDFR